MNPGDAVYVVGVFTPWTDCLVSGVRLSAEPIWSGCVGFMPVYADPEKATQNHPGVPINAGHVEASYVKEATNED